MSNDENKAGVVSDFNRELGMACQFCNTVFDGVNYHDAKTGHFEVVSTNLILNRDCDSEVWYCCHICRDNNEPCETFFPVSVIRCLTKKLTRNNPQQRKNVQGCQEYQKLHCKWLGCYRC